MKKIILYLIIGSLVSVIVIYGGKQLGRLESRNIRINTCRSMVKEKIKDFQEWKIEYKKCEEF